jgi:uncharacterized membrane protein YdfJ with MMPL/SSD domain
MGSQKRASGVTERLARACSSHPWRTLGAWGLAVVASVALAVTSLSGLSSDQHVTGKPESTKAADLIAQAFPPSAAERKRTVSDVIVVSSQRLTTDSPTFSGFVAQLTGRVHAAATDVGVQNYLAGDRSLVAPSRHATVIPLNAPSDSSIEPLVSLVKKASTRDFAVAITGDHTVNNDFAKLSQSDLQNGELAFGLPAAMIVLVLVFGAVVAGLVPVVMALLSILVGLGLVALLSLEFNLSVFIVNMLSGMGLALGIDYSLFIVSRYREERSKGAAKERAITLAGATASRAVLFSGTTFVVALFGMLIVPTSIMRSLAAGAIIVGLVSVTAALTLLPALLGLLGDHVNSLRVPFLGRNIGRADSAEGRFWRAIVDRVLRRPALSLILGVAVMLAATFPIFGLHIGASGVSSLPDKLASKQGYLALQRDFPVQNPYPARIVVDGGRPAAVRGDLAKLERRLAADPRFGAGTIESSTVLPVSMLSVPVRGDEVGNKAIAAVRDLRKHVAPAALAGSGARVYVGGRTAENADYFDAVTNPTPFVLAFVLGFSFLVLILAFRSLVVALISILLNLLSVGAAYGLLTLVFIHGVGSGLLGFQHVASIDAWVPLFLFSVLFGLSMDYQVFLMSRIKEHYDETGSTRTAVASGVATTARIITGAALIVIVVFTGFARGDLVMFQQMGFGVAVALALDATLIRSVVLPSALSLLDKRSWYLPHWLDWLPHVEVEQPVVSAPAPEQRVA